MGLIPGGYNWNHEKIGPAGFLSCDPWKKPFNNPTRLTIPIKGPICNLLLVVLWHSQTSIKWINEPGKDHTYPSLIWVYTIGPISSDRQAIPGYFTAFVFLQTATTENQWWLESHIRWSSQSSVETTQSWAYHAWVIQVVIKAHVWQWQWPLLVLRSRL